MTETGTIPILKLERGMEHRESIMGLPGSKKLMDEFELHSERGKGTTMSVVKWMRE
jgi:anti-sigma regulatory factor (Ser/Thr protein kinase)